MQPRRAETANAGEAALSAEERGALDRVQALFPGIRVGNLEPCDRPQDRFNCAEHVSLLAEADAALSEDAVTSSWRRIDLLALLDSGVESAKPTLGTRSDGASLLYSGARHDFHGPPESLKSWLGLVCAKELLGGGGVVVWIDFEDHETQLIERLVALGVSREQLDHFRYVRPVEPLGAATQIDLRLEIAGAGLVVVDGVTEAMALHGLDPLSNRDVAAFATNIPRIATANAAAFVAIDHVAKGENGRGAIGAQHKLAALDASYLVTCSEPFARGRRGVARIRVAKDRRGHVRGSAGGGARPTWAEFVLDGTGAGGKITAEIRIPHSTGHDESGDYFRPTTLMRRVSEYVANYEDGAEPPSRNRIERATTGKAEAVRSAIDALVREGYLSEQEGERGSKRYRLLSAFVEENA